MPTNSNPDQRSLALELAIKAVANNGLSAVSIKAYGEEIVVVAGLFDTFIGGASSK